MLYTSLQACDTVTHINYKQALKLIALLKKENENIDYTYYKRNNVRYMTLSGIKSEKRERCKIKYQDLNLENK